MSQGIAAIVSSMKVPLAEQLSKLHELATTAPRTTRLREWGRRHLALEAELLEEWVQRAWWGLAAGEVLRVHLYDENRRAAALDLFNPVDWEMINKVRRGGGLLLAAAHIGPPKAAMNLLLEQELPLYIWTNTEDMPSWLPSKTNARFLDPLIVGERSLLLFQSALHLRKGGLLFGAPDWPSGANTLSLQRFGLEWKFSKGMPSLARLLRIPTVLLMALWENDRLRISTTTIEPPEYDGSESERSEHHTTAENSSDWDRLWLERYFAEVEKVIAGSPENLRFLRQADRGMLLQELKI